MPDKDKRDAVDVIDQQIVYVDRPRRSFWRRERRQGLGCLGTMRLITLLPVLVIALLVGCMMLVMMFEFASFMRDPLDNFLGIFGFDPNAEPEVRGSVVVVREIKELAELVLQEATTDVKVEVVNTGAEPDAELDVTYEGSVVKAGIDLSQVTEESIVVGDGNRLTITLPPVYLTSCDLGRPDYDIYCINIPFIQDCNAIIDRLQDAAYLRAKNDLREAAYELELLALAEAEAEAVVYALVEDLGYTDVVFLHSAEEHVDDETCFPN
ncbi:MAG: DUF4230 domain-containing protein [Anaerolineae bacterium]|nr:DUF4230 domain-containing protein [Anaerolineae bacterium]